MKIRCIIIIFLFLIFTSIAQKPSNKNPYSVLKLNEKATKQQISSQYKKLQQKNKNNKANQSKIKKAYLQITSKKNSNKKHQKSSSFDAHVNPYKKQDEAYMYGYKISFQFNDGKNFRASYNQSQFIVDRSNASVTYKRIYALILLFGSMLFKIMPCLLLACLCRCKLNQGTVQNALQRARTGYSMMTRRVNTRT